MSKFNAGTESGPIVRRCVELAFVWNYDHLIWSDSKLCAVKWHSDVLPCDHNHLSVIVGRAGWARDEKDFVFGAASSRAAFGADSSIATEPNMMRIFDEGTLPAQRSGRANRAAELEVICGSKEQQFGPATARVFSERHRSNRWPTEII